MPPSQGRPRGDGLSRKRRKQIRERAAKHRPEAPETFDYTYIHDARTGRPIPKASPKD
jgi:hypothetical protein